jgi:uncharacterized OB-fold protein
MTRLHVPPAPPTLVTDRFTAPFFEAARERRLVVCACAACGTLRMPPGPFCPRCQSPAIFWKEVPGTGTVFSYTIVHRAVGSQGDAGFPYAPVIVALDGAPEIRVISALVECESDDVQVDRRVRPVWHVLDDGHVVPFFTLA